MTVEAKIDSTGLKRMLKSAQKRGASGREVAAAMNRVGREHKPEFAKEITKSLAVSLRRAKKPIKIDKATPTALEARVWIEKEPRIPIKKFNPSQTPGGVIYNIHPTKQGRHPHGFIVKKIGGHAFERRGKTRFPIDKLFGASPWGAAKRHVTKKWHQSRIKKKLKAELVRLNKKYKE